MWSKTIIPHVIRMVSKTERATVYATFPLLEGCMEIKTTVTAL